MSKNEFILRVFAFDFPCVIFFVPLHMLEELHPLVGASKTSTLRPVSQSWCNNTLYFFCNILLGF
jgi:hypothetical protein